MEFNKEEIELIRGIGATLELLRENSGFKNPEAFASEIRMDASKYIQYENGFNINIIALMRLLSHHDLTLEEFFKFKENASRS